VPNALTCEQLLRDASEYVDGQLSADRKRVFDAHAAACAPCMSVLNGLRNVVQLVSSPEAFELPAGFSQRLYSKLDEHLGAIERGETRKIPAGITEDSIPLGSHLIYFWENDNDFERGVSFLYPGLGKGDHCILFGHDEALARALNVLRAKGYDTDELINDKHLTVLRRHASADKTLAEIGAVVESAIQSGANAVRYLGNLGVGRDPLPAGEDDVVDLEERVSGMIAKYPAIVVCMYDVHKLSGHLIMRGGLQTHSLTVCSDGIHQNPYYVPGEDSGRPNQIQ
jgi:hypothetical protein